MPVRAPTNHGHNVVSWFSSYKLRRSIGCESTTEFNYAHLLDFDRSVTTFMEQPFTIAYEHAGKQRRYTPDFHVQYAGRDVVVECKPATKLATEDNQRIFAAAEAWCIARDVVFTVITDEELTRGWRLQNIKFLAQFRGRDGVDPHLTALALALLAGAAGSLPLGRMVHELLRQYPGTVVVPQLFHLLYHQEIVVPLDEARITRDTPARLPER